MSKQQVVAEKTLEAVHVLSNKIGSVFLILAALSISLTACLAPMVPASNKIIQPDVPEISPDTGGNSDNASIVVIQNGTLIDGTGAVPVPNMSLVIVDGIIDQIGATDTISPPESAQVIDAQGKWIMPGLIDSHVHLYESASLYSGPALLDLTHLVPFEDHVAWIESRFEYTLSRYLCAGITSIVDLNGPNFTYDLLAIADEATMKPRIAYAGRFLANDLLFGSNFFTDEDPALLVAETEQVGRALVQQEIANGVDIVKIGYVPSTEKPLAQFVPILKAMVDEAHNEGYRVAAHAFELETAREMVKAGVDILGHLIIDHPVDADFVQLAKDNDVTVMTTAGLFKRFEDVYVQTKDTLQIEDKCGDPQVIASWSKLAEIPEELLPAIPELGAVAITETAIENLKLLHQAGVRIAAGTDGGDTGAVHGPVLFREFNLMSQAGMSPMEILVSATQNAGYAFDPSAKLGLLHEGYLADVLVVNQDPTLDIQHAADIAYVISDGQIYDQEFLVNLKDATPPLIPHLTHQ